MRLRRLTVKSKCSRVSLTLQSSVAKFERIPARASNFCRCILFHCAGPHTFGTRATDGGTPLSAVKDVIGHSDIRTTMRYVHATDEGKRPAVEAAVSASVKSTSAPNLHHIEGQTA